MNVTFIVLIVFGSAICVVALICAVIVIVSRTGKNSKTSAEDSQMTQEIYHGLSKMESRMEALETILLERESRRDI